MLGLTILKVEITVDTNGGTFSTHLAFQDGLNVIRAENSSGKSTCINAISYGLGLEAILGPSKKRPFPKSLYEEIYSSKKNENPYFVSSSCISVLVKNSKNIVAELKRDVQGNANKITVKIDSNVQEYFLGSSGEVGSAKSEKGFHHWLANFIEWELPTVITYEGRETKLYLECIFPLFFVEQKRGWSEIQANTPTNYGIQNVKRSATEFCLGIDSFEYEKKISRLKNEIDNAKDNWEILRSSVKSIADFNSLKTNQLAEIDNYDSMFPIEFSFLESEVYVNIFEQKKALERLIEELSTTVSNSKNNNEIINTQINVIRRLRLKIEDATNSIDLAYLSIEEVEKKLGNLRHDYDQYQQLRRLKNVGASIQADLDTRKCPICESDLYDTLGNRSVKREPMTLEENIEFLKNQIDFFSTIKKKSIHDLQEFESTKKLLSNKIAREEERLSELRTDIDDINGAAKNILREKIEAEIFLKDVDKLIESQKELNEQASSIHSKWEIAAEALKLLRKAHNVDDRGLILNKLAAIFKGNLSSFKFKSTTINSISISEQTLRPEQEGYDIVAESSASDYIRIIWSYTLALLELASTEEKVKHGGFVVFDEPRQHEASKLSFASLIQKASETLEYRGQVILATSLDVSELNDACKDKNINLKFFDDYILTLDKTN